MHSIMQPSYDALPLSAKRCFVSFALFPEDAHVPADELLQLWSSWALLPCKRAHEAATHNLNILQQASLVLCSETDIVPGYTFHMHDVLRDLACSIAQRDTDTFGLFCLIQVCTFVQLMLHHVAV